MKQRIANHIAMVFLLIAVNASFAATPSRQSLEELLESSGLNADLKEIERILTKSAVEEASKNNPQDEKTKRLIEILLAENLKETFQYSLLVDEVTYFLKKQVSEEDVQTALEWYRTPLGQRIVQAEAEAGSPTNAAAIQRERDELLKQQDLSATAAEVDQAIGLSDSVVDLQINSQKAMVVAGLAILAPGKDITEIENTKWTDIKTSDRDALRQPIQQHIQATFVYTMKDFSQEEREKYRVFLLKPGSVKIYKAIMAGMSKAVEIGTHNFMNELVKDIKNPTPELEQILKQYSSTSNAAKTESQLATQTEPAIEMETEETSGSNSDW